MRIRSRQPDLGRDPVGRLVVRLAVPAVAAQIINLLYNLVDRMYVGAIEGAGTDALAGLGVVFPITLIVSAFSSLIGMGGALDSSRFKCYLAKATGANINNVDGMVIGGHGDTTMIPLVSKATVNGVPVSQFASKKKLEEAVANTMVGGATLTKLIGTSAWYAPGAASAMMVEAILNDQKKMIPCSCLLEGEYGQSDICIGVPAIIGRKGIEKIVKIDLTKEEAEKFAASAEAVRKTNNILHEIKAL